LEGDLGLTEDLEADLGLKAVMAGLGLMEASGETEGSVLMAEMADLDQRADLADLELTVDLERMEDLAPQEDLARTVDVARTVDLARTADSALTVDLVMMAAVMAVDRKEAN
jgi:hypothetical protein